MRPAEVRPWTRDQRRSVQWLDREAKSKERRSERGNKGELLLVPHKRQNATERENGEDQLGGSQLQGARSDQTDEVRPGRGSHDQPLVRTLREGQGRSQSELEPLRELEDPTLMGTSKVSSRDSASKAPSASTATSTGRKAGARGKHTGTS